jgi:hypothetical protein
MHSTVFENRLGLCMVYIIRDVPWGVFNLFIAFAAFGFLAARHFVIV